MVGDLTVVSFSPLSLVWALFGQFELDWAYLPLLSNRSSYKEPNCKLIQARSHILIGVGWLGMLTFYQTGY